ncbi:MAG: phospholipase D-like domain-containing protein [Cellulosilyticaceae bacterium]
MAYYFSRVGVALDKKLIEQIDLAKYTLDIAIYAITRNEIVNSIIAAAKRGVVVRIICDKQQGVSKYEAVDIQTLKDAKIPLKANAYSGLMHLKMSIIDDQVVTLGSYNYTAAATVENDEVLIILSDKEVIAGCKQRFEAMWKDTKNYKDF